MITRRLALTKTALLLCLLGGAALPARASVAESPVTLMRTPDGGLQPQVAVDKAGTVHLIYLKGEPGAADVYYARQAAGETSFSKPIKVNSEAGSAIAMGTIRGAQLALGKKGRVHVAWNGSSLFKKETGVPMLYARLNDAGTAFEPQRNLITATQHLDGGGTVAADANGNVYVVWHAAPLDNQKGEAGRAVFIARSTDDGLTFAPEKAAVSTPTGACGCCGMRATVDSQGNVFALYRAATQVLNRDIILLSSRDQGTSFTSAILQPWKIGKCPMSSESLYETDKGMMGAWEVNDQVYFAPIDQAGAKLAGSPTPVPSTAGKSKHPAMSANRKGELLVAWTEGTGWQKGGALGWQIYDAAGKATAVKGHAEGVPAWGLVAAYARPDGGFVILY